MQVGTWRCWQPIWRWPSQFWIIVLLWNLKFGKFLAINGVLVGQPDFIVGALVWEFILLTIIFLLSYIFTEYLILRLITVSIDMCSSRTCAFGENSYLNAEVLFIFVIFKSLCNFILVMSFLCDTVCSRDSTVIFSASYCACCMLLPIWIWILPNATAAEEQHSS